MAGNSLALVWDLIAKDNASPAFTRVAASADKAAASTERSSATIGGALTKVAKVAGLAGVAFAAVSVKMAADFQTSVTKLQTTAGESAANLRSVGDGMLDMAGKVGIGANELAKGMYTIESSGIHGANALTVLKAAAQGARQEGADLTHVADALSTVLHDYNLPADQAASTTSKLVEAVAHGKTTFDELTASLHSVTPLAAALHVPLADILGSLSAMTASGESADQATQNMADALRHLQSPTATMTAELAQIGITSANLATDLGSKGLAGTMQEIEGAILNHIDPATKRVLLPAFNESKTAAQDLQVMLAQMPPTLAKLSRGLLDGSVTFSDYRKQVRGMGGDSAAMGQNFLSLEQRADGFNSILKAGGPAAQVYSSALQKAVGDSAGLTVALQLTGEHAAATNAAIKDIGKATADTAGNIKGWDEVQGNFNQQLAEAGAGIGKMAIQLGQYLLPVLTSTLGYVNRDVLPGIEHMGGAVADAAHWFGQLPTPIKDTALALGALGLSKAIGLSAALTSGMTRLGASFAGAGGTVRALGDEMAVQARLQQMEAASIAEVDAALGGLSVGANTAAGSLTAAQLSMRGWDAALAQTVIEEDAATASTVGFGAAMATLAIRTEAAATAGISRLMTMLGGPWVVALAAAGAAVYGLVHWLQQDHDIIPKVKVDTDGLTQAIEANNGALDGNVRRQAAMELQQAGLFKAAQQWGISLSTLTDAALGNGEAIAQVTAAASRYKQTQLDAAHSTAVQNDQTGIAADAYEKAAMQSDVWAKALGVLTNSTTSTLGKTKQINEAVGVNVDKTGAATGATNKFADAAQQMGADVAHVWGNNTVVLHNATGKQIDDLEKLGGVVTHLPNHQIVVSANTQAARDAITRLTADYHNYSINLGVSGIGATLARAAGGPIFGPGTGTSDSIPVMASNGEHMWTAKEVAAAGGHGAVKALRDAVLGGALHRAGGGPVTWNDMFLQAKVGISPSSIAAAESAIKSALSFAGGNTNIPGGRSAIAAQVQAIAAQRGWGSGAEWAALVSVINHESGFNPNAANPTSSARGLFQKMTSIYGPVESTVTGQTNWGLNYIGSRYGDPIGAARHEAQFGWYDGGGWLMPGLNIAMNGTGKPERVRTAGQEAALQKQPARRPVVIHMYDTDNRLIGTMRGIAQQEADSAFGEVHDVVHYAGG